MKKPLRRYYLNPKEYAKIISEKNTNFDKYSKSRFGIHYSYGIDGTPYCYYFVIFGYDNYMIYFRKDMSEVII